MGILAGLFDDGAELDDGKPGPVSGRVGRYRLLARLAVGGMAEIFLARTGGTVRGFEKLVVLKRMLPQHAQDPELVRMFLDEARLCATFNHPHVTQVYEVGRARGAYFFTMEYVHGRDLGAIFRAAAAGSGHVPDEHAVAIVAHAAAGLHYAHGRSGEDGRPLGIVHRDVTPSNVLVSYDGAVKVTDFGVAKWRAQSTETRHGTLKGKLPYMSPEQTRGEALDARSDVFALGILLYELATGTRLFEGASDYAILSAIVNQDAPPPSSRRRDFPADLERVVIRALRRDRDQRFASAQELQLALEDLAREWKVSLSAVGLSRYMYDLFGGDVRAWQEARAEGRSLVDHVARVTRATAGTRAEVAGAPARGPRDGGHAGGNGAAPAPRAATPLAVGHGRRRVMRVLLPVVLGAGLLLRLGLWFAEHRARPAAAPPAAPARHVERLSGAPAPPPPVPAPAAETAEIAPPAVAAPPTPRPQRPQARSTRPSARAAKAARKPAGDGKVWDPDSLFPPQ